ncbi:MAG: cysteine desulfurase family protein [Myxococcales bacterium]
MKRIYLDHNATTPLHPAVLAEMLPCFEDGFGNPSSPHALGQHARRVVERARERVAALIGAQPDEIVFTSGGTEADNLAILGAHGGRVVTTAIEHQAVLAACDFLERRGTEVVRAPVDEHGVVDLAALERAITPGTGLVSVMLANNEVGTLQPVETVCALARERGVLVHSDTVQAVGRIPVDVRTLGVDLLSLSAHKIYGPKGAGALYVRRGVELAPLMHGGHQERHVRAGTENVPAIAGLGKACELARQELEARAAHTRALRDRLERLVLESIPGCRVNGHPRLRLPNTLNLSFERLDGELLVASLDSLSLAAATTSACSSSSTEPSHVLLAMGRSPDEARSAVRFSFGPGNTELDVDRAHLLLLETVESLRTLARPRTRIS